ncbi:MAG: HAD family hydrolase, partial [Caulobacteraceae bacterium]
VRAAETIAAQNLSGIDIDAEVAWVERGEIEDVDGVAPIKGAVDFVKRLPPGRWAVVTSCTPALARARMAAAGLDTPPNLVTAADVALGKPAPDGFLKGAEMLGVDIADCLVFEDAPAGIEAGERSGADVAVVTAAHIRPLPTRHRTVDDYDRLGLTVAGDGLRLAWPD